MQSAGFHSMSTMSTRAKMVLQALAALLTVAIGAFLAPRLREDSVALAGILGFVVVALFQLVSAAAFARPSGDGAKAPRQEREDAFDRVMEHVVDAVKLFLSVQREYESNLSGLSKRLSPSATRTAVQDVIVELMNRNMEMQAKVKDLSRELQAAQQQIVSLRDNVAEAGKIALTDALTELGNRRFFDQTLAAEISRAHAIDAELCLALVDLDNFKAVNDRFGHIVGDQLLRQFGELLAQRAKGNVIAARYGGEEFALLFPGVRIDKAAAIAESIRRELEKKRWMIGRGERLGTVTASFGVARLATAESTASFIDRADAMLYEAKDLGRNRVVAERLSPESSGTRALAS
jgi:diguanylate cyclase